MYPGTFALTTPDKPAVVMGRSGERVSYFELNARSQQLAQLLQAGVRHRHDTGVGFDSGERIVGCQDAAVSKGVEQGGFANIGQADDADG